MSRSKTYQTVHELGMLLIDGWVRLCPAFSRSDCLTLFE